MLQKLTVTFEHIHKEPSLLFMAFFTLIVIATIVVWGTIHIATIVPIIKNALRLVSFGREGYLTNTLPVSAHQLILSKTFWQLFIFGYDFISRCTRFNWHYSRFQP